MEHVKFDSCELYDHHDDCATLHVLAGDTNCPTCNGTPDKPNVIPYYPTERCNSPFHPLAAFLATTDTREGTP